MFYRVLIKNLEATDPRYPGEDFSKEWVTPYYFRSYKRAVKEALFWDKYFGKKPFRLSFIGQMKPTFTARIAEYRKKPEGIFMRATEPKVKGDSKKKSTKSKELTKVLKGEA